MQLQLNLQVLSSTVLSTHLVVSSQLSKFQMFPLNQCNFHLYEAATTIKHLWSPLNESQWPVCIDSSTCMEGSLWTDSLQPIKLWITFQIKLNPCFSPEISINSDFEKVFFFFLQQVVNYGIKWHFLLLFLSVVFCGT